MNKLRALVVAVVLCAGGHAHAVPTPDTTSCTLSSTPCMSIASYGSGPNAAGLSINTYGGGTALNLTNSTGEIAADMVSQPTQSWNATLKVNATGSGAGMAAVFSGSTTGPTVRISSGGSAPGLFVVGTNNDSGVFTHSNPARSGIYSYHTGGGDAAFFGGKVESTVGFYLASDGDYKQEYGEPSIDGLSRLHVRSYKWKDQSWGKDRYDGLVAQEVREIYPELVTTTRDGMLSVNYVGLVPKLLKRSQDQDARISALEKQTYAGCGAAVLFCLVGVATLRSRKKTL